MITKTFSNIPILKDTKFTGVWSNSYNLDGLTISDVYAISQLDDPERFLPIGTEIAAKDYWGYNNPWVVVHYGTATVYNETDMTTKKQKGFYLQQKYHCPNPSAWTTNTAVPALTDQYGFFQAVLDKTVGVEYMALYKTGYHRGQFVWLPVSAQLQGNDSNGFTYYKQSNLYPQRIASRLSSAPGTIVTSNSQYTLCANAVASWQYATKYNYTTVSLTADTSTSRVHYPRLCCFIRGKDID